MHNVDPDMNAVSEILTYAKGEKIVQNGEKPNIRATVYLHNQKWQAKMCWDVLSL